jgi:hypothetical protein
LASLVLKITCPKSIWAAKFGFFYDHASWSALKEWEALSYPIVYFLKYFLFKNILKYYFYFLKIIFILAY